MKSSLTEDLKIALERKRALDIQHGNTNHMVSYTRWVVDAIELLVRAEQERMQAKVGGKNEPVHSD